MDLGYLFWNFKWIILGVSIAMVKCFLFPFFYVKQAQLFFKNDASPLKKKPFTLSFFIEFMAFIEFVPFSIGYLSYYRIEIFNGFALTDAIPILYTTFTSIIVKVILTWCNRNSNPAVVGCSFSLQVFYIWYLFYL